MNVPSPGHFRVRTDLLEELGFPETMVRSLPFNESDYLRWLWMSGQPQVKYPLDYLQECRSHPDFRSERHVLSCAILPGRKRPSCFVTDVRGCVAWCEPGGLFQFVLDRAIDCAQRFGFYEIEARTCLIPVAHNKVLKRSTAKWSIGYASDGICTVLARTDPETEQRYLEGDDDFQVPFDESIF